MKNGYENTTRSLGGSSQNTAGNERLAEFLCGRRQLPAAGLVVTRRPRPSRPRPGRNVYWAERGADRLADTPSGETPDLASGESAADVLVKREVVPLFIT